MKSVGAGVVLLDSHGGYLDLTPAALEHLVSKEPITQHYQVEHTPFARGKFAAVRRARCLRSGTWFAAKVMRKRRRAQDVRHEILHEAAVLLLARPSSRIVSLHQLYETASEIVLVLELAEGGELQRVIDEEESLCEEAVRRYMTNILAALRFLHAHNIAHLDLKPQNLLLMGEHPVSEVKLCDFGISRIILSDIEVREVLGTPDYVAPEILQYEPISLATDMWSVGVLAYVLLTGHSPFGGNTKQETFLNISQGQVDFPEDLFGGVSGAAIDFITRLLLVDPGSRLTVEEAMQHQWLSDIQNPARPLPAPANTTTSDTTPTASLETITTTTSTSTTPAKAPVTSPPPPPSTPPPPLPSTPPPPLPSTPPPSTPPPAHNPISPSGMASYHYITGGVSGGVSGGSSSRSGRGGGGGGERKENRHTSSPSPTPPPHHHYHSTTPTSTPPCRRGAKSGGGGGERKENRHTSSPSPTPPPHHHYRSTTPTSTPPCRRGGERKENRHTSSPSPTPPHHHHHSTTPTSTPPCRRGANKLNKENNRNTINKHTSEEHHHHHHPAPPTAPPPLDSPSKPRARPGHHEKGRREGEGGARKVVASGKENKEVKEVKEVKLRPSPLCLRRQGSKCDLKSPGDQHKCGPGQASVSIILEKGIIC